MSVFKLVLQVFEVVEVGQGLKVGLVELCRKRIKRAQWRDIEQKCIPVPELTFEWALGRSEGDPSLGQFRRPGFGTQSVYVNFWEFGHEPTPPLRWSGLSAISGSFKTKICHRSIIQDLILGF